MNIKLTFEEGFDDLYYRFAYSPVKKRLLEIEGISKDNLDLGMMSYNYFTKNLTESTIDQNANANEDLSANNYLAEVTKPLMKIEGYYLLWKYTAKRFGIDIANDLIASIWNGDLYFHDSSGVGIQIPYCYAFSTTMLMLEGRPYGQLHSLPPKRADSFMSQIIETTMDLSQEFAGAISPSDLIVNYSYFAKKENLPDYRILNDLQRWVHTVNNKFRLNSQSPFTNISLFDRANLEKVFDGHVYPDGSRPDIEYIAHVQELFGDWFSKGDPKSGLPYRFPVVTANLMVDSNKNIIDGKFLKWLSRTNIDKGVFNIYVNDGFKVATCCRLSNDFERMKYKADVLGNGGMNIGSVRVITINLPRIALQCRGNENEFFKILDKRLEQVCKLHLVHREEIIQRRIDGGFLKFFNPLKWFNIEQLFSTIGILGIYETNYFMGYDITSDEGIRFTTKLLNHIEKRADEFSTIYKHSWNVEEIPGESTAVTLCKKDKVLGYDVPFNLYSNQYIPLIVDAGLIARIKLNGKFMSLVSGGGILHLNIKERIPTPEKMEWLIELAVKEGVDHLAVNYGFGICENEHVSVVGNSKSCPICEAKINDYMTRIIGYFTKISSWNSVRREFEFPNRKFRTN